MAELKHLATISLEVETWNAWRKGRPLAIPDVRRADLHRAKLSGVNLSNANLNERDLADDVRYAMSNPENNILAPKSPTDTFGTINERATRQSDAIQ